MHDELEPLIDTTRDSDPVDLLHELEEEARRTARRLENAGRLPHGFVAQHYPLTTREHRENERLAAALLLANDWQTYIDLARGRTVPRHRLDPRYLHLLERWAA